MGSAGQEIGTIAGAGSASQLPGMTGSRASEASGSSYAGGMGQASPGATGPASAGQAGEQAAGPGWQSPATIGATVGLRPKDWVRQQLGELPRMAQSSLPPAALKGDIRFENRFWLQIMGDHCRFIANTLPPRDDNQDQTQFNQTAKQLASTFDGLLSRARNGEDVSSAALTAVQQLRALKTMILSSLLQGLLVSGLPPTFYSHMLRELDFYFALLQGYLTNGQVSLDHVLAYLDLWITDAEGHADSVLTGLDATEAMLRKRAWCMKKKFSKQRTKVAEFIDYLQAGNVDFPALRRLTGYAALALRLFSRLVAELRELIGSGAVLGSLEPLMMDHMLREECYTLTKLELFLPGAAIAGCDPTAARLELPMEVKSASVTMVGSDGRSDPWPWESGSGATRAPGEPHYKITTTTVTVPARPHSVMPWEQHRPASPIKYGDGLAPRERERGPHNPSEYHGNTGNPRRHTWWQTQISQWSQSHRNPMTGAGEPANVAAHELSVLRQGGSLCSEDEKAKYGASRCLHASQSGQLMVMTEASRGSTGERRPLVAVPVTGAPGMPGVGTLPQGLPQSLQSQAQGLAGVAQSGQAVQGQGL